MISKYMAEINKRLEELNKLLVSNDYFKNLEERINKVNELYLKQIEITTELNARVMLKDKQIKKALEYIDRRDLDWGSEEHECLKNILSEEE